MDSKDNRRWYHNLCRSDRQQKNKKPNQEQVTVRKQVVEDHVEITQAQQVDAEFANQIKLEIICATENLKWWPRQRRHGKAVHLHTEAHRFWTAWNTVIENDPYSYVFGIEHPSSPTGYLYASVDGDGNLALTEDGNNPTGYISNSDSRIFRHVISSRTHDRHLKHVNTGLYVAIRQSRKRRKLELVAEDRANTWIIDY